MVGKKIIHITLGKVNPNRMNGVNKVVHSLANTQAQMGYDVEFWGITKNLNHDYPKRNFKTELFQDRPLKFVLDPAIKCHIEQLEAERTIFHLHGAFLPQLYSVSKLLVKHNIPYIYTPHGAYNTVAMKRSSTKKQFYNQFFESYIVNHAKSIHCIGKSELLGTNRAFGKVESVLIPNGQKQAQVQHLSIRQNKIPIFGFIGRLDMQTKGLDILLHGFSLFLSQSGLQAELWLLGDGPDRQKLEALAQKLNVGEQVKFLGAAYGQEKMKLMKQFDYLCLNSRNEGLPGVVLEAASIGIPSIVSRETNVGDFLIDHQAGFVLKQNSNVEMAKTLTVATSRWKNKEYEQMSLASRSMISQDFNWTTIAQKHIEVYEG